MARYHINPETGEPGVCKAKDKCPFGDLTTEHYNSKTAARAAYELRGNNISQVLADRLREFAQADEKWAKVYDKQAKLQAKLTSKRKAVLAGHEEYPEKDLQELARIEKQFDKENDNVRHAFYARQLALRAAEEAGFAKPEDRPDDTTIEVKEGNRAYTASREQKPTFDAILENEKYRESVINEFAAWADLGRDEAEAIIDSYDEYATSVKSPMTRDEFIVSQFQNAVPTRDRVWVDIETNGLGVTNGEIIEIGIIHTDAQGKVIETVNERFDLEDPEVRSKLGVGKTELHHIAPEDVAGKPCFTDPEVQERIGKMLNDPNVVFVSHNHSFEQKFLNHFLKGFKETHDPLSSKNIVSQNPPTNMQDTRITSTFLLHTTPNNRLESFCQATGAATAADYAKDAHGAFWDADTMRRACDNFRVSLKGESLGKRPELRIPEV